MRKRLVVLAKLIDMLCQCFYCRYDARAREQFGKVIRFSPSILDVLLILYQKIAIVLEVKAKNAFI